MDNAVAVFVISSAIISIGFFIYKKTIKLWKNHIDRGGWK